MGAETSQPLPDLPTEKYLCIALFADDKIEVLYGGKREQDLVRQAILYHWNGIHSEKPKLINKNTGKSNCYQFKLLGQPFCDDNIKEIGVAIRRMASKILLDLYNVGWKLLVSSDLSRHTDLATWIFERVVPKPNFGPFFSIALSGNDKLQINDCPSYIVKLITERVTELWTEGIQKEHQIDPESFEIKLEGMPWNTVDKKESCKSKYLVCQIIKLLADNQYYLYANSNLKSTTDTLFFQYEKDLPENQEFVIVNISQDDCIRLIYVPDDVATKVEQTVRFNWTKSIHEIKDSRPELLELKLGGIPWASPEEHEEVAARKLIAALFENMASIGYIILTGLDVSRKSNNKSLLLFKRTNPDSAAFFSLSLGGTDKIRLVNAPRDITEIARELVMYWPMGIEELTTLSTEETYKVKLGGNPWSSYWKEDGIHGRALLIAMLSSFSRLGWRLMCSIDDQSIDIHSWYFMFDESLLDSSAPPIVEFTNTSFNHDTPVSLTGHPNVPHVDNTASSPLFSDAPPSYEETIGQRQ